MQPSRTMDVAGTRLEYDLPSEGAMATQTANLKETQHADQQPELIATTFGNLTRSEIRDWERMLGQKLIRIANEPSTQAQPVQRSNSKPRHQR
jgi:hypothetical protein